MNNFFLNFDWNGFWLNVLVSGIFLILSLPIALSFIPYFTIKRLQKKNKNYIGRKISFVIQETCDYLTSSPFKDKELNHLQISIFSNKKDIKNYRFIGLINLDVSNPITSPKIMIVIIEYFKKLDPNKSLEIMESEKNRLEKFRLKLEDIINIHSLHVDDETISKISNLCLDIRSFEQKFKFNYSIDDLIESGKAERLGVFGITELAKIYQNILILLKELLDKDNYNIEKEIRE